MIATFDKLRELEKEGYEYTGEYGYHATSEPNSGGIHFIEMNKYNEKMKLEFDLVQWKRVKKYLRIN